MKLSVIICAHNPRPAYLERVLDALRIQSLAINQWELLLIDNASATPLETIYDLSWHPNSKIIVESNLGLSSARASGITDSQNDILVFVDDDNVLAPDYLETALRLGQNHPELGTWGSGDTVAEYEIKPPADLLHHMYLLALRDTKTVQVAGNFRHRGAMPWGAGLCVRRDVALAYVHNNETAKIKISGRTGKHTISGDDVKISYVACSMGRLMGLFPELKITHLIPKQRISADYIVRLLQGNFISDALLAYKWEEKQPRNYFTPYGILSLIKNTLRFRGMERRFFWARVRANIAARKMLSPLEN